MRRVLIVCAIVLGLAYAIGIPLFLRRDDPSPPSSVDAVVALSGSERTLPAAQTLVLGGVAPVLVLSTERSARASERAKLCRSQPKEIVCVAPDPFMASSEQQVIARLARERRWDTLVVVGPDVERYRMERAFGRCPDVNVVVKGVSEPWWRTAVEVPLEWVKLAVSETVRRGC